MDRSTRITLYMAVVVSMGGFLFGFDASVISGVIRFIKPQFDLTDIQLGWVVSSPSITAMLAMLGAGPVSDRLGRKQVLQIVAVLYILSAVLSALAVGFPMLVAARMVGGVAFGAALVLAPMYISEIAPADQRGRLVSVQQLNIVLGFSAAYFSNYLMLQGIEGASSIAGLINEDNAWRWMLGVESVPAVLFFFLLFTVPQSPRWLYGIGRREEALSVLSRLHGEDTARQEIEDIRLAVREDASVQVHFRDLLVPSLRYVLLLALLLGVLQQITGVNAIYFYATTIFEKSGIGANASFAQAVWVGVINVLFTLVAMYLIDRTGRRPLLLTGLTGIALSMCLTAYGFSEATYTLAAEDMAHFPAREQVMLSPIVDVTFDNDLDFKQSTRDLLGPSGQRQYETILLEHAITMNPWIVLFGILGFVASFAVSLGPVMWVMISELFPTRLRGLGLSVTGFLNSFVSWFVQFVFPWELSTFGNTFTYLAFAAFAVIGFGMVFTMVPETKGKTLEEIERQYTSS